MYSFNVQVNMRIKDDENDRSDGLILLHTRHPSLFCILSSHKSTVLLFCYHSALSVSSGHRPLGFVLLLKSGHGIFNVRNEVSASCAQGGETGTDGSVWEEVKESLLPCLVQELNPRSLD